LEVATLLKVTTDESTGIVTLEPQKALAEADFTAAAATIDPLIEKGALKGLVISTRDFPSWESFGALASHLSFVRDHHKKVSRVAIVTDSRLGDFAEKLGSHFIAAEIRHFPFGEIDAAKQWIGSD
jgi:hypothetical protein